MRKAHLAPLYQEAAHVRRNGHLVTLGLVGARTFNGGSLSIVATEEEIPEGAEVIVTIDVFLPDNEPVQLTKPGVSPEALNF